MEKQVLVAWVGLAGPVIGALIATFGKDMVLAWSASSRTKELKGTWACEWTVDEGKYSGPNPINDLITFSVVDNLWIEGKGNNANYGEYDLRGRSSDLALAMTYGRDGDGRNFVGTAIFRKPPSANELVGTWRQFGKSGEFIGGSVVCKKQS